MKEFVRGVTAALFLMSIVVKGQIPKALLHSLPAPPVGLQSGAQLGYSVAVDGALTVVGAPFDYFGGRALGVVKVFNSTTGALLHVLPNPSSEDYGRFGWSVAVSGTRVVVGAIYFNDGSVTDSGRAYVYDLVSDTPTQPIATLSNPDPMFNEHFGTSVAISGNRVAVGTPYHRAGGFEVGRAYVYDLTAQTPTLPVTTLDNPSPAHADRFGNSVAISGTNVAVGAPEDDITGASNAGSAYVFDLSSTTPGVPAVTLNDNVPIGTTPPRFLRVQVKASP